MLSSKIPRKQPDPAFQVYEDENDSEVAAFLSGQEPLAFSFTGIPLSRTKAQSTRQSGPPRPPPPEKASPRNGRLARARHGSVGSLSIDEASSPRVDGSGDGGRRSRSRVTLRPPRSSSCARLTPRKDAEGKGSGDPDRLAGLPLRQSLPLLRRSLSDLNAALGVDPGRSRAAHHNSLEDENRRLEADWTLFCRQLSEEPRKTAVVPPFAVVPPPPPTVVAAEEPPRPSTPSRIPVPRAASPARVTPRRSMSVCQEGLEKAAAVGGEKAPIERRASCDFFKISTPLVTGRSSIVVARASTPSRAISGGHRSRRGREA